MKNWTSQDQETLDALTKKKDAATGRFGEDVDTLLQAVGMKGDSYLGGQALLKRHGQAVLDMLLAHFTPSPQPAQAAPWAGQLASLTTIAKPVVTLPTDGNVKPVGSQS